ncbi:MAG: hypothetical protein ACLRP3_09030 [Escherichia sp.]
MFIAMVVVSYSLAPRVVRHAVGDERFESAVKSIAMRDSDHRCGWRAEADHHRHRHW